jgi:hypothetical protein
MQSRLSYRQIRRRARLDDRRALAFEKKYAKLIHKALIAQALNFAKNGFLSNEIEDVLTNLYYEVSESFFNSEMEGYLSFKSKRSVTEGFFSTFYNDWIKQFIGDMIGLKIANINDTTLKLVQGVINNYRGSEFSVISAEIKKVMNTNTHRSMMIARTEVGNMANATKEKSGDEFATSTGVEVGKIWIHRGAKNPRDWHVLLDNGQVIPKNDNFVVVDDEGNTELMLRPHADSASAKNVINCGCQVMYVPIDYNEER